MRIVYRLSLGTKFTLLLALVFLAGMVLSWFALSQALHGKAEREVISKAQILLNTMNSVRQYTTENINLHVKPLLDHRTDFIRETVPGYAALRVFDYFRNDENYRDFRYKEATLNPTNPLNKADTFEARLVERFRGEPDLTEQSGFHKVGSTSVFYTARPIRIKSASCLACHSTPAAAPASMVKRYGDAHGFGWQMNEVVGSQIVYVPADAVFSAGQHSALLVTAIFVAIFALAALAIIVFFRRVVVRPLGSLAAATQALTRGELSEPPPRAPDAPQNRAGSAQGDEIGQLADHFDYMAREVYSREERLRQARAEVALSEAHFRSLIEHASDAVVVLGADQHVRYASPSVQRVLGFAPEAVVGRSPVWFVSACDADAMKAALAEKPRRFAQTIHRSSEALLSIIDDILDFSKIEAGKLSLENIAFDVHEIVYDVAELFTARAHEKGLELKCEIRSNVPRCVFGDPNRLRQVLSNLTNNAIKFTERGRVVIRLECLSLDNDEAALQLSVIDTGIGLDSAQRARLFQSFTQADSSTTRKYGGTGLGLAISKELVEMMGGTMLVSSAPGQGSCFYFNTSTRVAHDVAAPVVERVELKPLHAHVLLAEDNAVNRELAIELLASLGCTVEVVKDGREAVAAAQDSAFDVVLMDCQMPEMDGFEATATLRLAEFREGRSRTPIVALTANAMAGDRERCLAVGMDDYLTKPFRQQQLRELLVKWVPQGVRAREPDVSAGSIAPTLDMKAIATIRALQRPGAPDLLGKLSELYCGEADELLGAMREGIARKDHEAVQRAAHQLKSSSANMGALTLSGLCAKMEADALSGGTLNQPRLMRFIDGEMAQVRVALDEQNAAV